MPVRQEGVLLTVAVRHLVASSHDRSAADELFWKALLPVVRSRKSPSRLP